jgi:hypothetical protein
MQQNAENVILQCTEDWFELAYLQENRVLGGQGVTTWTIFSDEKDRASQQQGNTR